MENDRGPKYLSFCCPTCCVETENPLCKCPPKKEDNDEREEGKRNLVVDAKDLGEESPLKKDQSSTCKIHENFTRGFRALIFCLVVIILSIIGALLLNVIFSKNARELASNDIPKSPSKNISAEPHGAVATDHADCSRIGASLLQQGGNAVDAGVAAAICIAVVAPHKTGLGGGGRMMIYSHRDRISPLIVDFASNTNEGIFATAKVRVPGFLRGLEFAQSLRGNLPWKKIVEPSVKLAESGFVISVDLARETTRSVEHGMIYGHLRAGGILQLPVLAETLRAVGEYGCDILYNGSFALKILRDAVVREDLLRQLSSYEPRVTESQKTIFQNHVIYLPRRANIFRSVVQELDRLKITKESSSTIEAQILAARSIIRRVAENTDVLKNLEQEKYSAVAVMDPKDNYVSIVTGLSAPLGLSHMTGAGFLLDGIGAGNSLDLLTPIIFHDEKRICELRGVFGTDDPTIAAQILYNVLLRVLNVSSAIEYPRYYMLPDGVAMENDEGRTIDSNLLLQIETFVPLSRTSTREISKSVNGITKHEERLTSHSDSRGGGQASRY